MKQAKPFKIIFSILFLLLSLITILSILIIIFFPKDELISLITTQVETALNKKLTIEEINYSLQGIKLKNINIYEGLEADNDLLISADNATINFSLYPLLKRQIIIRNIILEKLKIKFDFEKDSSMISDLLKDLKSDGESTFTTEINFITLISAELDFNNLPKYLKPLTGEYILDATIEITDKDKLLITDSLVILPDERGKISSDLAISLFDNDFEIIADPELNNCSLSWVYQWGKKLDLPYKDFNGKIRNLKITKNIVAGFVEGDSHILNSKLLDVNGYCRVDIPLKRVMLIDTKGSIQNSNFFINEFIFNFNGRIKKFEISNINSDINDLGGILTFLPTPLFGRITGNLIFDNKFYNGVLKLNNAGFSRKSELISDVNTEIVIKNNRFQKEKIPIKINKQPCLVSIAVTDNNFKTIAFHLYSKRLSLNFKSDKNKNSTFPSLNFENRISGRIDIDHLQIEKLDFSEVSLSYSIQDKNISVNRIHSNFMGGSINAKGEIDLTRNYPYIDLIFSFDNIKVHDLSKLDKKYSNRIFGIADGKGNIEFKIEKKKDIYDSLKGKLEFNIDNGKMVDTGIQKGLGIWLAELKYKLMDIEFNKIYGNFNLIGPNCYINSFLFNADLIRLKFDGYFNRFLEGDINIYLEFNKDFIRDIPNLTRFLAQPFLNKKGDWYYQTYQDKGKDITDSKNIKPL